MSDTENEPETLADMIPTPREDKELAWQAWREAWNERGSTNDMSQLEESTARTRFERWWKLNHE